MNSWSPSAKVVANTALLSLLSGASVGIYDANDQLLGLVMLASQGGTVDAETGALTLSFASDSTWVADGTASYATLFDNASIPNALQSLPCVPGVIPQAGKCVLTTLSTTVDSVFSITSWVIP